MAENPALTVARILGGVVLLNGHLGHQILGQLLITNSNEVAIAGAAAAVAATSGQANAAAQIAIRTAVPALAVRALLSKQQERIERREALVAEREQQFEALRRSSQKNDEAIKKLKQNEGQLMRRVFELEAEKQATASTLAELETERQQAAQTIADYKTQYHAALTENETFRIDVLRQKGLGPDGKRLVETTSTKARTKTKAKTSSRRQTKKRKPKA